MPDAKLPAPARSRTTGLPLATRWLIGGGVVTALSLVVILPMAAQNLAPTGIPGTAAVVIATLYAGMVIVRYGTPGGLLRIYLLAADLVAIVFVAGLTVVLVLERMG